jgi:hypothetical protein
MPFSRTRRSIHRRSRQQQRILWHWKLKPYMMPRKTSAVVRTPTKLPGSLERNTTRKMPRSLKRNIPRRNDASDTSQRSNARVGCCLMWCHWCDGVKPVPEKFQPRRLVAHVEGTHGKHGKQQMFVDYTMIPTKGIKQSNVHKKTMAHLWKCARSVGKRRSDFGQFFDKTYGNKPTKEPRSGFDSSTEPRAQGRERCKPRFMTLEKCAINDAVLKCAFSYYVKRLPDARRSLLEGLSVAVVDRGVQVALLDQEATKEMRKEYAPALQGPHG